MSEAGRSVLLCITVYNGREFVPRCIDSALALQADDFDLDILVLDDASPEPGFSEQLASFCAERGVGYYCTPRNLGIPRNVSLGLLTAVQGAYSHVIISNSDVIYSANAVAQLLECVTSDPKIGSVTAYSNNVSIYSIPNEDPDRHLANQDTVDWLGAALAGHYGRTVIDGPAGISFSIIIPTAVVRDVGVMDPVFGRGYCEETDWTLRSRAAGYRVCVAPGAFVYHQGGGSNMAAGLLRVGETTVPGNERIIDLRYPLFRSEVAAFDVSGILQELHRSSQEVILSEAGRQFGYVVHVGWLTRLEAPDSVRVLVAPSGTRPTITASFRGFSATIDPEGGVAAAIRSFFGSEPAGLDLFAAGPHAQSLRVAFAERLQAVAVCYPERV